MRVSDRDSRGKRSGRGLRARLWVARSIGLLALAALASATTAGSSATGRRAPPLGNGPVLGRHAAALDSLIPHACGVWLTEVTRLREVDDRATDGGHYQVVEMRPIRGTGLSSGGIGIGRHLAEGRPLEPWPSEPAPPSNATWRSPFRLAPDALKLGQRYWLATIHPDLGHEGLAGIWPEGDPSVTSLFEAAIAEDAYAWRPVTQPNGWTLGWFDPPPPAPTRARVWRVGRLMWDKPLEGRLTHGIYQAWQVRSGNPKDDLHVPGLSDTGLTLLAEVNVELPERNRFDFPAGKVVIRNHLDLWTGRLVASRGRAADVWGFEIFQSYDPRGRVRFERVLEHVPAGGLVLGADEDRWLRKVERTFDPRTRLLLREEVTRHAYVPLGGGRSQAWLPVGRESAYALAPLKRAYQLSRR